MQSSMNYGTSRCLIIYRIVYCLYDGIIYHLAGTLRKMCWVGQCNTIPRSERKDGWFIQICGHLTTVYGLKPPHLWKLFCKKEAFLRVQTGEAHLFGRILKSRCHFCMMSEQQCLQDMKEKKIVVIKFLSCLHCLKIILWSQVNLLSQTCKLIFLQKLP